MKKENRYIIRLKTKNEDFGYRGGSKNVIDDYMAFPEYFKSYDSAVNRLSNEMPRKGQKFVPAFSISEFNGQTKVNVDYVKPLKFYITSEERTPYHDKVNSVFEDFIARHSFI